LLESKRSKLYAKTYLNIQSSVDALLRSQPFHTTWGIGVWFAFYMDGHNPFTQIPGGGGGGRPEGNALFRSPQPFQLKIKKE